MHLYLVGYEDSLTSVCVENQHQQGTLQDMFPRFTHLSC